jgi:tripartite-type tricarboxylate transporter receptor subunit TctC
MKFMRTLLWIGCLIPFYTLSQEYPTKPIKLVIPYVAGGGIDIIGRSIAQKLSTSLGQNVIVDHLGGAGGLMGTNYVAKALPDGYTLLVTSSAHTTIPSLAKENTFDPIKDFMPVSIIAWSVGHVLAVHPNVPVNTVQELIAYAKANPGKLRYGSGGKGSFTQFAAENFNLAASVKIDHIPYKGNGQALVDCIAGHIEICFIPATAAISHIKSKQLKALATTASVRWSEMPNTPTLDESGLNGFNYVTWYGLFLPAKTPTTIAQKILTGVQKLSSDPELKKLFSDQGLVLVTSGSEEFQATITKEYALNKKLAQQIEALP